MLAIIRIEQLCVAGDFKTLERLGHPSSFSEVVLLSKFSFISCNHIFFCHHQIITMYGYMEVSKIKTLYQGKWVPAVRLCQIFSGQCGAIRTALLYTNHTGTCGTKVLHLTKTLNLIKNTYPASLMTEAILLMLLLPRIFYTQGCAPRVLSRWEGKLTSFRYCPDCPDYLDCLRD